MLRLVCVPPDLVGQFWPHVEHHIRKAITRGGMGSFRDTENGVLIGGDRLWLATDGIAIQGVAITSISGAVCTIVACGGDYSKFGHLIEGLEQYAKLENCKAVRICGRPGWVRRLNGYRIKKVIIEKAI